MGHFLTHAHVHVLLFRLCWWTTCVNRPMGLIVAGALWIWSWIGSWERCHKRFKLYQTWPKSIQDFIKKFDKEFINCGTVHPLLADFCTAASSLPNLNDRIMLFGFTFMLLSTQSGLRVVLGVCIGAHGCVSAASLSSCGSFCSSSSGESSPAACSGQ